MKEQFDILIRKPWFVPAVVGVASFGGGLAAGYALAKFTTDEPAEDDTPTQLQMDFEEANAEALTELSEVARGLRVDAEEFLASVTSLKTDDIPDVDEVDEVDEADTARMEHPSNMFGEPAPNFVKLNPEAVINVFRERDSKGWDYEAELATRTSDRPYILHRDEFFNDEMGFGQSTLTYYAGDDILVDEEDVPVYNYAEVLGLLTFGHGSDDPNVVYIRNERLKGEFEVLRDEGSYEVEVLGGEATRSYEDEDLRHSKHMIHKFKEE